ncbi:MAG: hypothetical protein QM756_38660 [Polyangiaceae bacterium]
MASGGTSAASAGGSTGGALVSGGASASSGGASTGGSNGTSNACSIGSQLYVSGAPNPANACQSCQPTSSTTAWSNVPTASCVHAIAAGATCEILNGAALCWGDNSYGQVGNNSTTSTGCIINGRSATCLIPTLVSSLTAGVTLLARSGGHACAIVNGSVQCWGRNDYGQLADGSLANSPAPVPTVGLPAEVTRIAVGYYHSCAVANGALLCWGRNNNGQLGDASCTTSCSSSYSTAPVQVVGLTSRVTAITAGALHTCAIANGVALCWGTNSSGQLGNTSVIGDSSTPMQVQGLPSGITAIAAGGYQTCAIVNGAVWCWGDDQSTFSSIVPVQVSGLTSGVTAIAVGRNHACALVNGGVRCWGAGPLGDNTTSSSAVPVAVTGLSSGVTAISAADFHTCSLGTDSIVRCWGAGGELGNNSTAGSLVPVPISDPSL